VQIFAEVVLSDPGDEPVRERFAIGDERHNLKRHATYPSLATALAAN
jgi:hypothetical protein